jgi:hypothetical protein
MITFLRDLELDDPEFEIDCLDVRNIPNPLPDWAVAYHAAYPELRYISLDDFDDTILPMS